MRLNGSMFYKDHKATGKKWNKSLELDWHGALHLRVVHLNVSGQQKKVPRLPTPTFWTSSAVCQFLSGHIISYLYIQYIELCLCLFVDMLSWSLHHISSHHITSPHVTVRHVTSHHITHIFCACLCIWSSMAFYVRTWSNLAVLVAVFPEFQVVTNEASEYQKCGDSWDACCHCGHLGETDLHTLKKHAVHICWCCLVLPHSPVHQYINVVVWWVQQSSQRSSAYELAIQHVKHVWPQNPVLANKQTANTFWVHHRTNTALC